MKIEDYRRTGRTTRMLQDVVSQLTNDETKNALVIVARPGQISLLNKILEDIKPQQEIANKIKIESIENHKSNLDWNDLTIIGQPSNTLIFFDHDVYELTFKNILDKAVEYIEVTKT